MVKAIINRVRRRIGSDLLVLVEEKLTHYLVNRAPISLPMSGKTALVQVLPWLVFLATVIFFYGSYALWFFALGDSASSNFNVRAAVYTLMAILMAISIRGLLNLRRHSWRLIVYAVLLYTVFSIARALFANTDPLFLILRTLIFNGACLYLLFQIRELYRD